ETAALIWERIGSEEINAEELAAYLSSEYEIDQVVALRDVRRQLEEWEKFGLTV
ncbi:MAG TPA: PqqD family protein, partial [Candidatus Paraprevotella stercorigallinarum]|nr:PqqD family protein [Candidatus Paraprevotella stercorigallinarum]